MSFMSIDFRGISSQPVKLAAPVFHGSIDNSSAPVLNYVFVYQELSADQEKSGIAIYPAYCQRYSTFLLRLGLCIYCVYAV